MINKFTIYGERCSGTNFLEKAIAENFDIKVTWEYEWKHFFGFNKCLNSQDTLFIGVIRDPFDWLFSFHKNPHHIPQQNKELHKFLFSEFYSIHDDGSLVKTDLNYKTNKKYWFAGNKY